MAPGPISQFVDRHYRHFNAASVRDASEAWTRHLDGGGVMLLTLAGAMSTAELGVSLAEMIRQGKVHAICCTGANLEEDVFNLVAHSHYERIPHYRDLTPTDEQALLDRHMNRVTDTCIPEHEAMRRIETAVLEEWTAADRAGERYFPHEFLYRGRLADLRGADAAPGSRPRRRAAVGLLLPDQRLDDQLRLVLGRRSQREDHVGQAGRRHPEVHHRVGRHDRGAAGVREGP